MEQEIREFLIGNFPLGEDGSDLPRDASLLEAGIIDSTGVLELIGFLESRYGIAVADDELLPENLDSIDGIVQYVDSKIEPSMQLAREGSAHA